MWPAAKFKCFKLTHCYGHEADSQLGCFLAKLRVTPKLTEDLITEMMLLMLRDFDGADEDTIRLCSKKAAAKVLNDILQKY